MTLFAMYASVGEIATLGCEATWNQAILGIRGNRQADDRFIRYWLQHLKPRLAELTNSNTQDNLNAEIVGNLPFPPTSIDRQRAIADYLDAETARIDAIIDRRRRMLDLLAERRSCEVRRAVAGWPEPFPTVALKRRWSVSDCKHRTPAYVDEGYPVVSPGDVTPGLLDLDRCTRFVDHDDWVDLTDGRRPLEGDIIYSRNASIGTASLVVTDRPFCMGQDVCLISSLDQDPRYLTYALNTMGMDQLDEFKIGSTFNRVNVDRIVDLRVPCPQPSVQRAVADELDLGGRTYIRQVSSPTRQITLFQERRQALITAAVTGDLAVP